MSTWDDLIYTSEEYKERIHRARKSLTALSYHEALSIAAESIAYWQMRTVKAEQFMVEKGFDEMLPTNVSPRVDE